MKKHLLLITLSLITQFCISQNLVTYAGGAGNERFNDVMQLSNGNFIVLGSADNLTWVNVSIPNNTTGTNKVAFIAEFSSNLQTMLNVYYLPANTVENFKFVKTNSLPNTTTGNLYISGDVSDATSGGYFIGRLNNNFISGAPTGFTWIKSYTAVAGSYIKTAMPWDVGSNNKIVYGFGDSHASNWSAAYCLDGNTGVDIVVPNWRVHWQAVGGEYYGSAATYTGTSTLKYSGIVFKRDGQRCELRSTNLTDYNLVQADENGGTKKGKWPLDVCYNAPCVPGGGSNTTSGPGYTGYSPGTSFTYGLSSITIDKRTNALYVGFNFKTVLPGGLPDFEPAVMIMDSTGDMKWWTRLYHEMLPVSSNTTSSTPDQYIDAIAIDYSKPLPNGEFIIGARAHGNNTENLWEGNTLAANTAAVGFQKQFTGSGGNFHLSWFGRFNMATKQITNSTYMGEYAEGASGLSTAHPDPNLDGWPNPNNGWPVLNTTYMGKNNMKITANGSIMILGKGRRTITTANAYQKMVKPGNGGFSCWNDFVRVYKNDLSLPLYSSLLVGKWDTLTQANGDNVRLMGTWKTTNGIVAVGYHTGTPNEMPVVGVPAWGNANFNAESAVLAYLTATNIANPGDGPAITTSLNSNKNDVRLQIYPNPNNGIFLVATGNILAKTVEVIDVMGRVIKTETTQESSFYINISDASAGLYYVKVSSSDGSHTVKLIKK
jgi:Secretion system C-terminal sorting domain